ncbi:uncharacterized protein J3R85_006625, partial [Psidium guajava]
YQSGRDRTSGSELALTGVTVVLTARDEKGGLQAAAELQTAPPLRGAPSSYFISSTWLILLVLLLLWVSSLPIFFRSGQVPIQFGRLDIPPTTENHYGRNTTTTVTVALTRSHPHLALQRPPQGPSLSIPSLHRPQSQSQRRRSRVACPSSLPRPLGPLPLLSIDLPFG